MADVEMNLYEMNKQLMANEKPIDPILFNQSTFAMAKDMIDKKYIMLLCHDRRDYTVFNLNNATEKQLNKDIIECLKNRGIVTSIEKQKDGNYEIWIRDKKTKEDFVYFLFDYSFGVIDYE